MLTKRQLFILEAIIDGYTKTAEAVGSRSISKREDVSYSPATVRNEMADLETLGFLEKPHSSSGRIPSNKGYRYYVDHLLLPRRVSESDIVDIRQLFADRITETEDVIRKSAEVLSDLTSYISVALGPDAFNTKLKHLQIVPLYESTAVAVLVTDTGSVEHRQITLPEGLEAQELEKVVRILNDRLQGVPLIELNKALYQEVASVMEQHLSQHMDVMHSLENALHTDKSEKVYYGGKTNLLSQPEFKDVDKVRSLLELLEKDEQMHQLMVPTQSGITVKIGEENDIEAFEDVSMITATYQIGGKPVGTIGILGPTRMEYSRVIGLLQYLTHDLTKMLTSWHHRE
ncbi:heat-inducible transcription repressor HrcA [Salsuginibacillus halophilus]|uniref:Heat-inducible transcription repressor HrcA n=1 Tax=Salsuginibacillus halophilus TaxID=517424 RepID=A0A2P8HFP3_9BACI|nr:heat-inducible transcriptional repressor HrcA [Salsuginibacillus halophilus]PSL45036.1 heat-inducible transcription repressor HrcA [Salsuginibacillus halophilus]